ncbi:hypothetical protein [Pseudomonas guariconensis]|uniref:hypothetical protein n=1 Tax=Pseudomonas guariconensis TaxID=1288410 RepID=UPI0018A93F6F|nr:hypothetical protein [Pseudomonas guariconensis]MBF8755497.1 hypothetical protein [Pseudomonas guariconensis]
MNRIKTAISEFGVYTACPAVRYELTSSQRMRNWCGFEYFVRDINGGFSFTVNVIFKANGDKVELGCCVIDFKSSDEYSENQVCKIAEDFLDYIKSELEIELNIYSAPAPAPARRNKIKERFGNYRIHGVPTREDGCIILQEGMEENEYAAQYQRVILESTAGEKISFELMTLFYKDGYDACGPDPFFFHSHQFVREDDDTDVNNLIATAYTNHRLGALIY